MGKSIRTLLIIFAVQMAFKQASAQTDTLKLTVDSIPFEVKYTIKKGLVTIDTSGFNRMTWLLISLNTSVADYKALAAQYEQAIKLSDSTESILRQMVINRDTALESCSDVNLRLEGLLDESLMLGDRLATDLRKEKTRSRWKVAGGIALGVGLGVCAGLLAH